MEEAFCRDVRPEDLPGVVGALGDWLAAANGVLQARAGGSALRLLQRFSARLIHGGVPGRSKGKPQAQPGVRRRGAAPVTSTHHLCRGTASLSADSTPSALPSPGCLQQGIEQRIDWTVDATAAAERARGEAAKALEAERKSIRTTIELQARAGGSMPVPVGALAAVSTHFEFG